jgi:hypothetical protein
MMDDDDNNDDDELGIVGGMSSKGNRSILRKPTPLPLCPLKIPRDLIQSGARAGAVVSQRPTALIMTAAATCLISIVYT